MNKELKEAIEEFKKLIKLRKNKAGKITHDNCIVSTEKLQTVVQALENSIPKQVVEKLIEENKSYLEYANTAYEYTQKEVIEEVIKNLQKLLEGK